MEHKDGFVVAIGASAGGLKAIRALLTTLPEHLNAPIVIAMHSKPASQLTEILKIQCPLKIKRLEDAETLVPGQIYIVPGATHAFFRDGRVRLSEPVRNSGFRPSIDALFMTLAAEYKDRAIAVVLSGTMNDGTRGAQVIYDMGGRTVVQNPDDATFEGMPRNVILSDHPKKILSAEGLGEWIAKAVGTTSSEPA
ncbi:chemotaxis protein CheB [uncultured Roseobacter sp.]|uniref:chemotaxis protein CheB n=1 Tax=uncultured Roseobacter sp. TaxID=114847 RepID=UPI0026352567|nr:chemotaxis protein CheB [uncultured Roseobacter sp.]